MLGAGCLNRLKLASNDKLVNKRAMIFFAVMSKIDIPRNVAQFITFVGSKLSIFDENSTDISKD